MRIIKTATYDEMSHTAAIFILNLLYEKPNANLGLATGFTPKGLYRELIQSQRTLNIDLSQVSFFHLDEYLGYRPTDSESMGHFLNEQLFQPLNVSPSQIAYVPALENESGCQKYEALIASQGEIDLQILGIGQNGHIAFNEPGTPFWKRTHIAQLSDDTRQANARYFSSGETPSHAMTMGPATILKAKQILLLVSGKNKANAVKAMLQEPLSEDCPASILRFHPRVTLILDQDAASEIDECAFWSGDEQLHVHHRSDGFLKPVQKVMVAAPHPDDASIGCGGTLARLKSEGHELVFVSMSSGHRADIPGTTQQERVEIRAAEAQHEAHLFQSPHVLLSLDFYEQGYIPSSADIQAFKKVLKQEKPQIVFSASDKDRHPAHAYSAHIIKEAISQLAPFERPELWFYEGPWFLFERDDFNVVVECSQADMSLKLQGIQAHDSQVSRKRYDLAAQALSQFRAITTPESRLSSFGAEIDDCGEFVEVFQRVILDYRDL